MKRNGDISIARVLHTMQTNVVIYIANSIFLKCMSTHLLQFVHHVLLLLFDQFSAANGRVSDHRLVVGNVVRGLLGPIELDFGQIALQHLHEAVRVGMIMDRGAMTFAPAKDHQVEFPVASIH